MKRMLVACLCVVAATLFLNVPSATAALSPGQSGVIYFNSITVTSGGYYALATRTYDPTPVQIFGTLQLPPNLSSPVPAMVIAHGSGGVSDGREFEWADVLNGMGIAAFVVDSFTPRGIGSTGTNPSLLSAATNVADALKALELLATHPNIDPNRIGVMGGSLGGKVADLTGYEEMRQGIINGGLKFAAHVPMYPNCSSRYWSPNVTGAPKLFLLAELDDYNPALPCTGLAQVLAGLGGDVTAIIYPGAQHAFDSSWDLTWCADCVTSRNCADETRLDTWQRRRWDNGYVFANNTEFQAYVQGCTTTGTHFGSDSAAEAQAVTDVRIFLARVFNLSISVPASQPDRIFNWAQDAYPQYLNPRGTHSQYGYGYYYRCYSGTGTCIGVKDGHGYYLAPAIDPNTIVDAGPEGPLLDGAIQAGY